MKVLITGTSSGLGKSLVNKFNELDIETIGISKSHSKETNHICNFLDIDKLSTTIEDILNNNNDIDYVFLNAGMLGRIEKANKINQQEINEVLQVNVFSNKIILDKIISKQTKIKNIILISSGASINVYDGWLLYCLTKSAANQMIKCYSIENKDIHFLCLAPGIIQTKMQDEIIKNDDIKFSSIKKFKQLYGSNNTPDLVASKVIKNLKMFSNLESGHYFDLRSLND